MRHGANYVVKWAAQILFKKEEYRHGSCAEVMNARINLSKDEFAKSMGQTSNYAAVKDALIMLKKEEFV